MVSAIIAVPSTIGALLTFGSPLAIAVGAAGALGLLPVTLDHLSDRKDRLKEDGAASLYHVRQFGDVQPEESLADTRALTLQPWPYY